MGGDSDSSQDCVQNTELVPDGDAGNAHPELMLTTLATSTSAAGDVLTDIATGPVQPNINFQPH